MALSYMEKWLGDMTPAQMRKFILWQNTYDYDGTQIWHSKKSLARFCDLEESHPAYATFSRVYDRVTREYQTAIDQ